LTFLALPNKFQNKHFFEVLTAIYFTSGIVHLFLGANFLVVSTAVISFLLTVFPLSYYGFLNLGSLLIFLVGFRYVGFPLIAKIAYGQPLDTYLFNPLLAYTIVLLGIVGYLLSFILVNAINIGRPFLKRVTDRNSLFRISLLSSVIGITANIFVSLRVGNYYSGITIADFFTSFLHLSLISAIAYSIQISRPRYRIYIWISFIFLLHILFSFSRDSRWFLIQALLCFIFTSVAFNAQIKWRHLFSVLLIITLSILITPVYLSVRKYETLTWTQRIDLITNSFINLPKTILKYSKKQRLYAKRNWYLNYYGTPDNVLERLSLVNHVDSLSKGTDERGTLKFRDLSWSFKRAMPRFILPDKPLGHSLGYRLYNNFKIRASGEYSTAPLIGTGYVAFEWIGALFYPFLLGSLLLFIVNKMSGLNLHENIYGVFMLILLHNSFAEGSSDRYILLILRSLPQNLLILLSIQFASKFRFIRS